MRSTLRMLAVAGVFSFLVTIARGDSEIVIAIRYLQAEGISHSHLYLYREDGKLLRQLTKDNLGQDVAPIFDSSGETIVFTREKPNKVVEYWTIKPRGEGLKKLDAAPSWYVEAKTSPYFTNIEPELESSPTPGASPESTESPVESPTPTPTYKSPDGAFELVEGLFTLGHFVPHGILKPALQQVIRERAEQVFHAHFAGRVGNVFAVTYATHKKPASGFQENLRPGFRPRACVSSTASWGDTDLLRVQTAFP